PMYKVPKINIVNFSKANTVSSQVKQILLDQFTSEYQRVKQTIEQNNDPDIIKIQGYHNGMGNKFIIFPWANDILFEDGNLLDLSPSIINEIGWPAYEKFIQDLVNDQVN